MKDFYTKGIVILNYNTEEDTVKCVNSIIECTADIENTRIYIVDNMSPDGSGKRLEERFRDNAYIRVILSDKNGGFSYGNNLGIRRSIADGCKYVFLLNSDIYLLNDAIGIMAKALDDNMEINAIGPRIYNPEGADTQFARKALTFASHILERLPLLGDKQVRRYKYDCNSDYIYTGMSSGSCFGLRTDFITERELLDDNVFMYYEEDILAYGLINDNKKAMICSDARVVHNEGVSTKNSISAKGVFEKLHRWSSAMYVLKQYAGMTTAQTRILYTMNKIEWKVLSIVNPEYRDKYEELVHHMDEITK